MRLQTIPVVDLRDFLSDSPQRQQGFVSAMGSALEDIGFFAVINHGVDSTLIQSAYQVAEVFFELPETVKQRYEKPELHGQRGFTSFGREHAKDHPVPDLKEFWHVGASKLPNLEVAEVPQFAPILSDLHAQLAACAARLLEACALYLGESKNLLREMTIGGDTILRVIHYPPVALDAHPASLRSAPHEDINLITLLCEATAEGLELQQRDGVWRPIHALDGQIIVDSGDMLQQLTNGLFKSTTHRVVNPDGDRTRRFSMPYFVHPQAETDLTPLSSSLAKTRGPARFPPITAGAYLQQRLQEIGLKRTGSV